MKTGTGRNVQAYRPVPIFAKGNEHAEITETTMQSGRMPEPGRGR